MVVAKLDPRCEELPTPHKTGRRSRCRRYCASNEQSVFLLILYLTVHY